MFPITSRYHDIESAKWTSPDGQEIIYLHRRLLPDATKLNIVSEHLVTQDERLDHISARYLGDSEQFWRLCDANNALHPEELTAEIGRRLKITLP